MEMKTLSSTMADHMDGHSRHGYLGSGYQSVEDVRFGYMGTGYHGREESENGYLGSGYHEREPVEGAALGGRHARRGGRGRFRRKLVG
jgi:hypothetical protein